MLFAREVILSRAAERARPWIIHLRADSSPQFGRDFLVSQLDYVQFGTSCRDTVIICKAPLRNYLHIYKFNITQTTRTSRKLAHFSLPYFGTSMGKSVMEFFHVLQVCFIQQVSCKTKFRYETKDVTPPASFSLPACINRYHLNLNLPL